MKLSSSSDVFFFSSCLALPLQRLNSLPAPALSTHKTTSSDYTYTLPTSPGIHTCSSAPLLLPQFKVATQLHTSVVHGTRSASLSWVEMPSWTSHLLYCNHCWRIFQAYLFDESLFLCSEKEVQTFIRWLQPGLNGGEVKHEGGSGLDFPGAVGKCAPQLRWYFFLWQGGEAWQGETFLTVCESVSAQWYRTWEKVECVKL